MLQEVGLNSLNFSFMFSIALIQIFYPHTLKRGEEITPISKRRLGRLLWLPPFPAWDWEIIFNSSLRVALKVTPSGMGSSQSHPFRGQGVDLFQRQQLPFIQTSKPFCYQHIAGF